MTDEQLVIADCIRTAAARYNRAVKVDSLAAERIAASINHLAEALHTLGQPSQGLKP